jgi:hypothetical protein
MGVNTTGVTPAANFIPQVWANELSDASQAWTGLSDLVDRSFESQLSVGDYIEIPDAANPAVRVKSEDTAGTYANITETLQNIQITRQAYVGFIVEDIAELQSKYAVRSNYTTKSTYSLMAHLEGDATSGLQSLPSSFSQLVGNLGADPTTDNLIRAVQYLDDGDVPEGDRFFYMSPGTHAALLKQDVFVSGDYGPSGAISSGRVTKPVYGATTHVSTLASNNPSTSGQSYSWFCNKRGVALIVQRTPMVHLQWENLEIAWGVVVDVIYNFIERVIEPKDLGGGTSDDRFNVGVRGP